MVHTTAFTPKPYLMYEISHERYLRLLNGFSYTVKDTKGNEKKVRSNGLGSREKVIEYLNNTEGLLGTIVELVTRDDN